MLTTWGYERQLATYVWDMLGLSEKTIGTVVVYVAYDVDLY